MRWKTRFHESGEHEGRKVAVIELNRRKVDRNGERLRPGCRLTTRLLQNPPADRDDHAVVFGKRNKNVARHPAAHRMFPSDQRFESEDLAINSRLRLIKQFQLIAVE